MNILFRFSHFRALFVALLLWTNMSFAQAITPTAGSSDNSQNNTSTISTTITVHKPATDPAWGKVISYQQEVPGDDKNHEALYKFLFQDSNGVVRTVIYHESASGSGYWEVWVWDQP